MAASTMTPSASARTPRHLFLLLLTPSFYYQSNAFQSTLPRHVGKITFGAQTTALNAQLTPRQLQFWEDVDKVS